MVGPPKGKKVLASLNQVQILSMKSRTQNRICFRGLSQRPCLVRGKMCWLHWTKCRSYSILFVEDLSFPLEWVCFPCEIELSPLDCSYPHNSKESRCHQSRTWGLSAYQKDPHPLIEGQRPYTLEDIGCGLHISSSWGLGTYVHLIEAHTWDMHDIHCRQGLYIILKNIRVSYYISQSITCYLRSISSHDVFEP